MANTPASTHSPFPKLARLMMNPMTARKANGGHPADEKHPGTIAAAAVIPPRTTIKIGQSKLADS